MIERLVKLFEAGEYPDKGVTVTTEDLDSLVKEMSGVPIPFNIAHLTLQENPLTHKKEYGMGFITELFRRGSELWGKLYLPEHVNHLIELADVKGVSIGAEFNDDGKISKIEEVSWTPVPRVPTARIFGKEKPVIKIITFSGEFSDSPLSITARERMVRDAFYKKCEGMELSDEYPFLREVFDDFLIYEKGSKLYQMDYTLEGDTVSFGEASEVKVEYVPVEKEFAEPSGSIGSMKAQSLILSKSKFDSEEKARKWAEEHGFKTSKVDETSESYRFRQFPPEECKENSFRTKRIDDGATIVMCKLKESSKMDKEIKNQQTEDTNTMDTQKDDQDKTATFTGSQSSDVKTMDKEKETEELKKELERLYHEHIEFTADRLIQAGKMLPASKPLFMELAKFTGKRSVKFSEGEEPKEADALELITKFVESFDPSLLVETQTKEAKPIQNENVVVFSDELKSKVEERVQILWEKLPQKEQTDEKKKELYKIVEQNFVMLGGGEN